MLCQQLDVKPLDANKSQPPDHSLLKKLKDALEQGIPQAKTQLSKLMATNREIVRDKVMGARSAGPYRVEATWKQVGKTLGLLLVIL